MFRKPFKSKSEVQLKSTEKKKFSADLKAYFPALRDEDVSTLISNKDSVTCTKIITFKEEDVEIYWINKVPMYINVLENDVKLPTIFMVWKFPHILPSFTTNATVLNKLKNGADLFFPGIYTEGLFFCDLDYKKMDPVCVNLVDNKAAVAVGLSLVDKDDVMNGNKNKNLGRIVKVYHTVGDYLFKLNADTSILQLGPPDWALPVNEEPPQSEDTPKIGLNNAADALNNVTEEISLLKVDPVNSGDSKETVNHSEVNNLEAEKEKENELLEYCFLKALKTIPKASYPILSATFYANHVLTSLPKGQQLNIKKTKWKKFSNFLQEKYLEGIVQLNQLPKNELSIAGPNPDHKSLREFVDCHSTQETVRTEQVGKPTVEQIYLVSAATLLFFSKIGLKKNDELTRNEVRNHLNDYIKKEKLVHPENPEMVVLDPVLYEIVREEVTNRGNLVNIILEKMSVQHKVSNCGNGDVLLHKGKLPLIQFETTVRSGNKKVTLISNLESYGINVGAFSKELQHKAAASTTINPAVPGKKGPQVQVQGNQVAAAINILKEKYNINEKFMKKQEKAVKPKGKK